MTEVSTQEETGQEQAGSAMNPEAEGAAVATFPPPASRVRVGPLFLTVLIALAASLATVFLYDRYFATKIVAVDLKGFLAEQKVALASGASSQSEMTRRLDALEATLDAIPDRHAVVLGDVVVRNVEVIQP
jgi:hypothetical protein